MLEIGAQSYTVREYCQSEEDLARTLERIAAIGYRNIQLSAIGPIPPETVKRLCDRNGLRIVLTHNPETDFLRDTEELIRRHRLYECPYVGIGSMPERYRSPEGIARFAEDFRPAAEKLRAAGLKFMYHNHAFEFARLPDGRTWMDRLLDAMPAELMGVTADTYWLHFGGMDVCAWLREHADRLHCVHLKDYAVSGFEARMAPVGAGNLDFPRILEILRDSGVTEYALVEQDDCYGVSPFDCLRQSWQNLAVYLGDPSLWVSVRDGSRFPRPKTEEEAAAPADPRKQVWMLGDSVRMQCQKAVGEKLAEIAKVSGPEENGRWSGYTLNTLRFWLPNLPAPDLVQWNCGLWDLGDDYQEGRHFYPPELYEETCRRLCRVLRKITGKPDLPLVIATTTPTLRGDDTELRRYNEILKKVAAEENAAVNDLYAVVAADKESMIGEDHVHLTPAGVEACAEQTAKILRGLLRAEADDAP